MRNFILTTCILLGFLLFSPVAFAAPATVDTSSSNQAIANTSQRKTFFDTVNDVHWAFYYNGTAIEYSYSADGTSWTSAGTLAYNTANFSVIFKAIAATPYVFVVSEANSYDIVLRRGVLDPSNITFAAEQTVYNGTAIGDRYIKPTIALNGSDQIWVSSLYGSLGFQTMTRRSTNAGDGDLSVWQAAVAVGQSANEIFEAVILSQVGAEIYLLVGYDEQRVVGYRYDGSNWGEAQSGGDYAWFDFASSGFSSTIITIALYGSEIYAGGYFETVGGADIAGVARFDGNSWHALGAGLSGWVTSLLVVGNDLYVGGTFQDAGGVGSPYAARWDLVNHQWHALGSGLNGLVNGMAVVGTDIYMVGAFVNAAGTGSSGAIRWDSVDQQWEGLGTGLTGGFGAANDRAKAIAVVGTDVFFGGFFTTAGGVAAARIAKWSTVSSQWSAIGAGIGNGTVRALAVSGTVATDLYVAGTFINVGNASGDSIVRLNTTNNTWSSLGTGIATSGVTIHSIATSGANVYVVGPFVNAGGNAAADYIARWTGAAWSAFAGGAVNGVVTLTISGSDFYFGGTFENAGGVPKADRFAKWDGSVWQGMAQRDDVFDTQPTRIAAIGNSVFVGGDFTNAAGIAAADYIVRYDGENWYALGAGLNGSVSYLKAIGTDLYIFGNFTNAGGTGSNSIVRWDTLTEQFHGYGGGFGSGGIVVGIVAVGSDVYVGGNMLDSGTGVLRWNAADGQWEDIGTDYNTNVYGIETLGGQVYLGGHFEAMWGAAADYLVRWDPVVEQWSEVGGGINGHVYAMSSSESDVYVMGTFSEAGDAPANMIARWDGENWHTLGSGLETYFPVVPVQSALFRNGNLYITGGFETAGGLHLKYQARWDGESWRPFDFDFDDEIDLMELSYLAFAGENVYYSLPFAVYKPTVIADIDSDLELSAVSDAAGDIHLAYRNDADEIRYRRFDESDASWGETVTLTDVSSSSPSLSYNSTTGNLTAAWIAANTVTYSAAQTPFAADNWSTPVAVYGTGTNSSIALAASQETDDLMMHWTNGAANPYSIYSDFLPMTVAPTVAITSGEVSPSNSDTISLTIAFSADVYNFVVGDIAVTNATKSNFVAVDERTYTVDLTPTADGVVTANVAAAVAQDAFGNDNTAATQFSISYDATAASVVIDSIQSSPSNDSPIPITIEFSEAVSGFAVGDVVVTNGTKSNFVAVDGDSYTLDVSPTADGVVEVAVAAAVAVDAAGNDNAAATTFEITYDITDPTVSIADPGVVINLSNSSSFVISGTCSENGRVVSLAANSSGGGIEVTATPTCAAGAWSSTLNLSGLIDGSVTVQAAHTDLAGNSATVASRVVVKNIVAPVVTVTSSAANPTNANPIKITVEFNKNVSGFVLGDIVATNAVVGDFLAVSARRYTATLTPIADGAITARVLAGAAQDSTDNASLASSLFSLEFKENLLPTTICSVWNSFLSNETRPLWNIMEHVNASQRDLTIQSTLYAADGVERSNVIFTLEQGKQFDLLVHEMQGWTADSYGLVCSRVIDGALGELDGQMVYYKQADDGSFEFAFSSPFVGGLVGKQYVSFNSSHPSLAPDEADNFVANWVQVTNLSRSEQRGVLKFYDYDGSLLKTVNLTIAGRGQSNNAGHEWEVPKMGLVEWVPQSTTARFVVSNTRYLYDNATLQESFDAAFELQASSGSKDAVNVLFDTVDASSVIELSNVTSQAIYPQLDFYNSEGELLETKRFTLAVYASEHVVANAVLDNSFGQVSVSLSNAARKSLAVSVLQYGREDNGGVDYAYGLSARRSSGDTYRSSYNTFLKQSCDLYVFNPSDIAQQMQLSMLRYDGSEVVSGDPLVLGAKQSLVSSVCDNETQEATGVVTLEAENPNVLSSFLLRQGGGDSYRVVVPNR